VIWGANGLIGATGAPLGPYFLENILGIFSKNLLKYFLKNCVILLRFVLKICQKYVI
jgi:hypothetical protein